jgi:hypothetical protein
MSFTRPTVEQLALVSNYKEKWRAIATNTNRIDCDKVTVVIHQIYKLLNVNAHFLQFTNSPYSAILILKELIESRNYAPLNNLTQQIHKHLKGELTFQLTGHSDVRVYPAGLKISKTKMSWTNIKQSFVSISYRGVSKPYSHR